MKGSFAQAFRRANHVEEPKTDFDDFRIPSHEEVKKSDNSSNSPNTVEISVTRVTSTMEVYGEIKSKDVIQSSGQIFGNVATTQTFSSKSLTVGNVSALNVEIKEGRLKGDINCVENVDIGAGTTMVGNINCGNFCLAGKVKGQCDVRHDAIIIDGALLAGDLIADTITAEQGSRINGNITMRNNNMLLDLDKEFDLGGDF